MGNRKSCFESIGQEVKGKKPEEKLRYRFGRLMTAAFPSEHCEEFPDRGIAGLVSQRHVGMDGVFVLAAHLGLGDISRFFEVDDDLVGGPLGDAYRVTDFTRGAARVFGDRSKHHSVCCDKCPFGHILAFERRILFPVLPFYFMRLVLHKPRRVSRIQCHSREGGNPGCHCRT